MSRWPEGYDPLNGCGVCSRDFTSVPAFDAHRVGTHDHDVSLDQPDGRRCLSDDEMEAHGLARVQPGDSSRYESRLSFGVALFWDPAAVEQARRTFSREEMEA